MNTTRFISALGACILALSLTLAACGGGGGGSSDTGSNTDSSGGGGSNGGGGNTGGGGTGQVDKPAIGSQPASQSVVKGSTATFTVTATGGAPLAYQWKKNGADISGANTNTYTTPATSDADIGAVLAYSVVVSNTAGSATSTDAKLTVTATAEPPTVTTQPDSQSVITGASASFSVSATGTSPISYQWKKNGTNISGATSSTYTPPATSDADIGAVLVYSVVVTNSAGTATSTEATLTVTPVPVAITKQPADQTVTAGEAASFTVEATGTAPSYQWKKNDTNIPEATSSTYTTPLASSGDSGALYSVTVSNGAGSVTSSPASLTVTEVPVITTQPMSQAVATGQTASFSVVATGTKPLAYQWKKDGSDIAGATSSTYTETSSSALNGAKFSVVVTNSAGTATSNEAVLSDVAIGTQPTNQTAYAGQTASYSVTAGGTGPFTYQWKKNGTDISGATNSSYTTPATTSADIGTALAYSVVVSNGAGTVTSSTATMTVSARYSLVAKASGGTYDKTECVKDNSTGLVWEGKTASPATTRLGTSTYTNFDGTGNGQKLGGGNADPATEINVIGNSIGYKTSVNNSAVCGYTDWRLPTRDELLRIVETGQAALPTIDTTWFPNTRSGIYWTSSPDVSSSNLALYVTFGIGGNAVADTYNRYLGNSVRLVRCGAVAPATCTSN